MHKVGHARIGFKSLSACRYHCYQIVIKTPPGLNDQSFLNATRVYGYLQHMDQDSSPRSRYDWIMCMQCGDCTASSPEHITEMIMINADAAADMKFDDLKIRQ